MFYNSIFSRCQVFIYICLFLVCCATSASADVDEPLPLMPLNEALKIVTDTNPEILEALERYRSVKEERSIAKSGYYPKAGVMVSGGPEMTDGVDTNDVREEMVTGRARVYARQNLFDGGRTSSFVNETDARILAAAYEVLTVANRVYLKTVEAYINVLKAVELLEFSRENVLTQERILSQVKEKTAAGFTRIADLSNSEARLALAKGNYISRQQDVNQAAVKFHHQFGRLVLPEQFVLPKPVYQFPDSVEETVDIAFSHHPALDVAKYNIQARKYSYERAKADDWPTLELEVNAEHRNNINGDDGSTNQAAALLRLNYTIFDGGVRKGEQGKNYRYLHKEYQRSYIERRNVNQTVRLAWNIFQAEKSKAAFLADHEKLSAKTLEAFKEEYFLARRTLLDILNMENEYDSARSASADSRYAKLTAYYQISQATGVLLHEYDTGLWEQMPLPPDKPYDLKGYEELDQNRDLDPVQDISDQCDNSILNSTTPSSGCVEKNSSMPLGYLEPKELSPYIFFSEKAGPENLSVQKKAPKMPKPVIDKTKNWQSIILNNVYFASNSAELTEESRNILKPIAEQIIDAGNFNVEVVGHTDSTASAEYNMYLSSARARSVRNELVKFGVNFADIVMYGKGEEAPIASNQTKEGRQKNRRIELRLIKK